MVRVIHKINEARPGDYWIDMESAIRARDRFDVDICRRICGMVSQEFSGEI